jgi:dihydrofolate reductase
MPATVSIIAIIGKNRELGKNNQLIWDIPEDMKRFKELTQGHAVIMGRKTYESIGKKLEGRNNIVITENKNYEAKGCTVVCSIKKAIEYAQEIDPREVFIIGGAQIYKQALSYADKLYLTIVEQEAEADTFFPDYSEFTNVIKEEERETEDGVKYRFIEMTRN